MDTETTVQNQTQESDNSATDTASETGDTAAQAAKETDLQAAFSTAAAETEPKAEPERENAAGKESASEKKAANTDYPAWCSQLPEEIRSNADMMKQLSKFQKVGDIAKSYAELEKKTGASVSIPGENATDEERAAFWAKIGTPAEPDQYSIKGDEAKAFREAAHAAHLTDTQAQAFFTQLKEMGQAAVNAQNEQKETLYKETDSAFRKEYGTHYGEKMTLLSRGVKLYAGASGAKALMDSGLAFNPDIARMFIRLGEMSAESGSYNNKAAGKSDGSYIPTNQGGMYEFKGLKKK